MIFRSNPKTVLSYEKGGVIINSHTKLGIHFVILLFKNPNKWKYFE